jgi:hypothetical protein
MCACVKAAKGVCDCLTCEIVHTQATGGGQGEHEGGGIGKGVMGHLKVCG